MEKKTAVILVAVLFLAACGAIGPTLAGDNNVGEASATATTGTARPIIADAAAEPEASDTTLPDEPTPSLPNPQPKSDRPNVLVVMTDDQTVEQMSRLDAVNEFMELGTSYTSSLVNYPLCGPSRVTFLTGQYASNHQLECNPGLAANFRSRHDNSLGPWLQQAGVHTIHVGKYLNGWGGKENTRYQPPGWSDWRALAGDSAYNYNRFDMMINGELVRYGRGGDKAYSTDVLSDELDDALRAVPDDEQFFAIFTPLAPHYQGGKTWAVPAERHAGSVTDTLRPPNFDSCTLERKCAAKGSALRNPALTKKQIDEIDNGYQTASETLYAVDEAFEQARATLEELGRLDDTVIIFTSDNGFFYGEHGVAKGKIHPAREALFVPLAIRGPGFGVAEVEESPVVNADLTATILDIFEAQSGLVGDGQSLLDPISPNRAIYIQALKSTAGGYQGVYSGGWLFYDWAETKRNELYAPDDPHQLATLDNNPKWDAVEASLQQLTETLATCTGPSCIADWDQPDGVDRLGE